MPVQINEMTTEIIAEPEQQLAGTGPQSDTDRWKELSVVRVVCTAIARLDWRTRAEGFDD
jgi:hypothetical protein